MEEGQQAESPRFILDKEVLLGKLALEIQAAGVEFQSFWTTTDDEGEVQLGTYDAAGNPISIPPELTAQITSIIEAHDPTPPPSERDVIASWIPMATDDPMMQMLLEQIVGRIS